MATSSCWRASSSLNPLRSKSRKKPSPSVPSFVASRLLQIARTSGARLTRLAAEDLFRREDVRLHEGGSLLGGLEVGILDGGKAEQLGGVDDREEVVDFEGQLVGEFRKVLATAVGGEDLEQSRHAADGGDRQRCLVGDPSLGAVKVHT